MRRLFINRRLSLTYELIVLVILSSIHLIRSKHHIRYFHNHDRHRHLASHHKNSLNYLINPADASSTHHHHYKLNLKNNNALLYRTKLKLKTHIDQSTSEPSYLSEKPSSLSTLSSTSLSKTLSPATNLTTAAGDLRSAHNHRSNSFKFQLNSPISDNDNGTIYSSFKQPGSTLSGAEKSKPKKNSSKRYAYRSIVLNDGKSESTTQCKVSTTTQKRLCANCVGQSDLNEPSETLSNKKLIKIAVLAPRADNLPYSLNKILPSILHAVNIIENGESVVQSTNSPNSQSINFEHLTSKYQFRIYYRDTNCSSSVGPLAAFDFFIEGSVDVFFGPLCDYVLAPVTRYASTWNIPILTTAGQNDNFDIKGVYYRLLTRMNGSYSQMGSLLVQILKKFQWTVIGMLFHNNKSKTMGHSSCYFKLGAIFSKLNSSSNHYHESFDETDPAIDYVEILNKAANNARSMYHFAS